MQFKSLKMMVAVAETGSFVAAARQLHTVQSNVTMHVKKLETELGSKLFDRYSHSTIPTSAGRELVGYARKLLTLHDDAVDQLKDVAAPQGKLRIGTMETTAAVHLSPILSRFHACHREVEIELEVGGTAELAELLLTGKVDCAFVASQLPHKQLWLAPMFEERLALVTSEPYAAMPTAEQLLTTTFLAFRQGCRYRQRIELLLARYGLAASHISEFGSLDAILGCVSSGMGFSILPEAVIKAHSDRYNVYARALPDPLSRVTTYFAAKYPDGWTSSLKAFYNCVQ